MLGWIMNRMKGKEGIAAPKGATPDAKTALEIYSALITKYPNCIIDEKKLPLPREQMKALLLDACKNASTPGEQRAGGLGYVSLCYFQEGVGDTPLDDTVPDTAEAQAAKFTPDYIARQKRVNVDLAALHKEIETL